MKNKKKKILIIRPGAIGDVVHTTIIPKAIKNAYPDYEIHYLTQKNIAPILENNQYIDKVISLDRTKRKSLKYLMNILIMLFRERYDIIFNLTLSLRNILFSLISMPKKVVFRKYGNCSWVEDFFYTAKSAIPDIELPDTLWLSVNNNADKKIKEFLSEYQAPYIIIVPAGNSDKNRQGRIWNINNWKILTEQLLKKYNGTVFVCGSKAEKKRHEKLKEVGAIITSGEFSLSETSAFLSNANVVISGDTGPVHIASAHNVKTLALLGSTSPDKIKPYGKNGYFISGDTDCKFCWRKKCKHIKKGEIYTPCMESITPQMVMDSIETNKLL